MRNSTFSNNQAYATEFVDPETWGMGGAIYNSGGTVSIGGSTFVDNYSPEWLDPQFFGADENFQQHHQR